MITLSSESLLDFMQKNQYQAEIQAETQQIFSLLKFEQREFPLFIRIFDEGHLLQILIFVPSLLETSENYDPAKIPLNGKLNKPEVIADLARLLHLFNKELDVPGFGLDEMAGIVFYRIMLPTPKKQIDSELLLAYIKTAEHVCQMFSPSIQAVSSGKMTLDQILEKAQQVSNKESE
ncbi:MAG: YbjN domain-containing protein [Parachlamydiaceae bacterium]|nr:YbjN domain-containing protein [Parachlamydiaceae bacterium]